MLCTWPVQRSRKNLKMVTQQLLPRCRSRSKEQRNEKRKGRLFVEHTQPTYEFLKTKSISPVAWLYHSNLSRSCSFACEVFSGYSDDCKFWLKMPVSCLFLGVKQSVVPASFTYITQQFLMKIASSPGRRFGHRHRHRSRLYRGRDPFHLHWWWLELR